MLGNKENLLNLSYKKRKKTVESVVISCSLVRENVPLHCVPHPLTFPEENTEYCDLHES